MPPVTVTVQEAFLPLTAVAVITAVPAFFAVTVPSKLTEATSVLLLDQVMDLSAAEAGRTVAESLPVLPASRLMVVLFSVTDVTSVPPVASFTLMSATGPRAEREAVKQLSA